MADENRPQAGGVVEIGFEGKDAEHQVEVTHHLRDAAAVPGPDLWADVIDDLQTRRSLTKSARQAKIEAGIIDENHGIRFRCRDFAQGLDELPPKISIALHHFPKPYDRGRVDPIHEGV